MSARTQQYRLDVSRTQSAVICQLILFANATVALKATAKRNVEVSICTGCHIIDLHL